MSIKERLIERILEIGDFKGIYTVELIGYPLWFVEASSHVQAREIANGIWWGSIKILDIRKAEGDELIHWKNEIIRMKLTS